MPPPIISYPYIRLTSLAVLATAMTVLCSWILNISLLHAIEPYVPMKFNTALLFVATSIAQIALLYGRHRLATLLLVSVGLFAALTLLQYPLDTIFGIDNLSEIILHTAPSGRMTPATATAFLLLSAALFLCSNTQWRESHILIASLLGSITAALGMATLLAHVGGLAELYAANTFAQMAMSTAACFIFAGINVIVFIWKRLGGLPLWLPLPIYIGFVTISFSLAQAVQANEEKEFQQHLQTNVEAIASKGELYLNNLYEALERLKDRWIFDGGTPQATWEHDAEGYIRDFPFLTGLSYTDSTSHVLWSAPHKILAKFRGFQLNSEPRRAITFARAIDTRKAQVTRKLTFLSSGEKGFLYINPLYIGDRFDGSLVGGITYKAFLNALLSPADKKNFYLSAEEDGESLYSNYPPHYVPSPDRVKQAAMKNRQSVWVLSTSPTAELLASRNPFVPWVVLGVGLLTSFLIGISILLSLQGKLDNIALQKTGQQLEASNRLSDAILSSSSYIIIATDIHGKVIVFNREAERELGYRAEEVMYKATATLWHLPEEIEVKAALVSNELGEKIEGFNALVKKAEVYGIEQGEWQFVRKDCSRFPGLLTITPLKNSDGGTVGYLAITTNITQRKKQEEALRASEAVFRNTMEHASIGMALVSPDGKWLRVNNALCALLGYSENELLDGNFKELTHPDDMEENLQQARRMLKREIESYQLEKRYFHKDGHIIWVLLNTSMVWNSDGTPKHFIAQIQDITESKRSRQAMEALVNKLLAANEELEQFAYVASHDLQEPLRMVVSFTDLIRQEYEEKLDEDGKEYIELATSAARRMQHMISDLLEYARIDNKAESMVKVDTGQQLANVLGNLHSVVLDKGARITHDPMPLIFGNPVRFMRLLQNLVGNALKYQSPGNVPSVHIGVEDKGSYWRFFVRDNGIGIAKEYIDSIFLPFERLHSNEEYQGSGIGLAICRKIVESHGGTIGVSSQPGEGSTFYFTMQKWHERQ